MALVPDGGGRLTEMGVVAEKRRSGFGSAAVHHPVVAATQRTEAAQLLDLRVLFEQSAVDAAIFDAWWDNQRMSWIIAGFQTCRAFRAELGNEAGANDLRLPVAR